MFPDLFFFFLRQVLPLAARDRVHGHALPLLPVQRHLLRAVRGARQQPLLLHQRAAVRRGEHRRRGHLHPRRLPADPARHPPLQEEQEHVREGEQDRQGTQARCETDFIPGQRFISRHTSLPHRFFSQLDSLCMLSGLLLFRAFSRRPPPKKK